MDPDAVPVRFAGGEYRYSGAPPARRLAPPTTLRRVNKVKNFFLCAVVSEPFLAIPLELSTVMPQNVDLNRLCPQFVTNQETKTRSAGSRGTQQVFLEEM